MESKNRKDYIENELFPEAFKAGRFGTGLEFVKCELDSGAGGVDQYASSVLFMRAIATHSGGEEGKQLRFDVIVKLQPTDFKVRLLMNSDLQFHNELSMYRDILPKLDQSTGIVSSLFPDFYFGVSTLGNDPESDAIGIEDLRGKGFKLTKERAFLDYNHIVLALKALGKFHALSFIAKHKSPKEFDHLKTILKEHSSAVLDTNKKSMLPRCTSRGFDPLLLENPQDSIILKMKNSIENDPYKFMKNLVEPEEPMSVICHGDFLRNNILYSYDSQGQPQSIRFFDLQSSRYASPVIDLSLILWINTTYEQRSVHWNEFIKIYHESLSNTIEENGCLSPSLEQLQEEFLKKGIYGYIHCSYFLPIMVSEVPINIEQSADLQGDELAMFLCQISGDYGTKLLTDIVRHIVEFKCFS